MTSRATSSGVVAYGVGARPRVMGECTKPGRTIVTSTPEPYSSSARPRANESSPAFAEAYAACPARGSRAAATGEHDDAPLALGRHPRRDEAEDRHPSEVVGGRDGHRVVMGVGRSLPPMRPNATSTKSKRRLSLHTP